MEIKVENQAPKTFRKFGKLPGKPSELIKLALADFIRAEKVHQINMDDWYVVNGKCTVCFAGAVMAGSLGKTREDVKRAYADEEAGRQTWLMTPADCEDEYNALIALNLFREGNLSGAFAHLEVPWPKILMTRVDITQYSKRNRLKFRRDMRALAKALEKEGY